MNVCLIDYIYQYLYKIMESPASRISKNVNQKLKISMVYPIFKIAYNGVTFNPIQVGHYLFSLENHTVHECDYRYG